MADTSLWKPVAESPWKPVAEAPPGVPTPPLPAALQGKPTTNAQDMTQAASGFASAFNPVSIAKSVYGAVRHPLDTIQADSQARQALRTQGMNENQSNPAASVQHRVAGALPVVGPLLSSTMDAMIPPDGGAANLREAGSGLGQLVAPAVIPAATRGVGRALMGGAEPVAENALGIRGVDRKFGRNPGRAVLDETSGVRPATVTSQAAKRIGDLSTERNAALQASPNKVSLQPARAVVDDAITRAGAGNSDTSSLNPIREQLSVPKPGFAGATAPIQTPPPGTAGPSGPLRISDLQTPMDALSIRQRLGNDFTKFDMARPVSKEQMAVGNKAYGQLTDSIHSAVPESAPLDQRISNLIPARDAAAVKDLAPGVGGNMLQRIGAKTGALAAGGAVGFHYGGIPGAMLGAVTPEILADPTTQMLAARGMNAAGKTLVRPAVGQIAGDGALLQKRKESGIGNQ